MKLPRGNKGCPMQLWQIIIVYFRSARSLSSSHTPTAGSYFPLRMSPNNADNQGTIEEPLLAGDLSEQSAPSPKTKNMLCLVYFSHSYGFMTILISNAIYRLFFLQVSAVTFIGTFNLPKPVKDRASSVSKKHSRRVMQVGRKLLQVISIFRWFVQ